MKKSLSLLSAAVLTASCLPFADTNANATAAAASFYMKVPVSDAYKLDAEQNFIKIDSLDEDITVTANIFFSNPTNSAWSVSPKWKSSNDEYVTITKVNNPFDTPTEPFAYSVKGADGKLSVEGMTSDYSVHSKYNSCNFTVRSQDGMALTPYGSTSDAYPLISFEFTIDADTPAGLYKIYFTEDADNSTRCAMDATQNHMIYSFPDCPPDVEGLSIRIGPIIGDLAEPILLGDVNEDGKVDSADASLVLAEYGLIQTGGTLTFTGKQKKAADVNKDGKSDSSDASKILEYYGAISTGKIPSWD